MMVVDHQACNLRSLSSAGSERLPYKQRVGGSNPSATTFFAVWCNGSTRDSGSLSLGSSPGTATQAAIELNRLQLFCYSIVLYYNKLGTFGCPF